MALAASEDLWRWRRPKAPLVMNRKNPLARLRGVSKADQEKHCFVFFTVWSNFQFNSLKTNPDFFLLRPVFLGKRAFLWGRSDD